MKTPLALLGLLSLAALADGNPIRPTADMTPRLDRVLHEATRAPRIVGAVVMVAVDGQVVYCRAAGWADREAGQPMTTDRVFRLSSLTKPLVVATALALVDQGIISLDDPVSRWLPSFRPKLPDGRTPVLTVRHLLTHTGGLSYGFLERADGPYHRLGISDGLDAGTFTLEENVARIGQAPLLFPPGCGWQYSVGLDVLGAVLAQAAHRRLPDLVDRILAQPLHLSSVAFAARDPALLATPYVLRASATVRMPDPCRIPFAESEIVYSPSRALSASYFPSGGAGAVASAGDYLRFLEALRCGRLPGVSRGLLQGFFVNQVGGLAVGAGPGWGWTLGAAVLKDPVLAKSPMNIGACQWGGVYGHTWWIDPAARLSVVVMTNTALEGMAGGGRFPDEVKAAIYADAAQPPAGRQAP